MDISATLAAGGVAAWFGSKGLYADYAVGYFGQARDSLKAWRAARASAKTAKATTPTFHAVTPTYSGQAILQAFFAELESKLAAGDQAGAAREARAIYNRVVPPAPKTPENAS